MPVTGLLSAAVYDSNGALVQSLLQTRASTMGEQVSLVWDGKNAAGDVVPNNQTYQWRAIISTVKGVDEGAVGDSGNPSYGISESNGGVGGLAVDSSGDLYSSSWWEEPHKDLRKYRQSDGWTLWSNNFTGGYGGIATDGTSVYVARAWSQGGNEDRVYRFDAATGANLNYSGSGNSFIAINASRTQLTGYDDEPLRGMAVDSSRLWISNYLQNRLEVHDKNTGSLLATLPLTDPLGVVVQSEPVGSTPGVLWVAHSGGTVSKYTWTSGYTFTEDATCRITGLSTPYGLAIGGTSGHLFVTEAGSAAQHIRQYSIAGVPALTGLGTFGSAAAPGPVSDSAFRGLGAIAVDSTGRINVTDGYNRRVQQFNSNGTLYKSLYSEFQPAPTVDKFVDANVHRMLSGPFEYEADTSGTVHGGWMGDGTWRYYANYTPVDNAFYSPMSIRRTLMVDGTTPRDFIFYIGGNYKGVAVYAMEPGGMRRSAIIGGNWIGTDGLGSGTQGRWAWTDGDGDGAVESGEVVWDVPQGTDCGYLTLAPGIWVDEGGNLLIANMAGAIVKVPLQGWDAADNPIYNWSARQTVVARDTTFTANNARTASNGDIYAIGDTGYFWMGGHTVRKYNSAGVLQSQYTFANSEEAGGIAVSTDNNYWFSGHNSGGFGYDNGGRYEGASAWIDMWTQDGLRIGTFIPGKPNNGEVGWYDHGMSVYSFTNPSTNTMYVYGEEVYYGKSIRFRVDGLDKLQRLSNTFAWPLSPTHVTISATDALAAEAGQNTGAFTVTRDNTSGPLTVYYTAGGTASANDYQESLVAIPKYSQSFDSLNLGTINGQDTWSAGTQDIIQSTVSVSGRALKVDSAGGAYRTGIFDASAVSPKQQVTFQFRLASDINDFAGTPNVDIQHTLQFRGPDANSNSEYALVYKAYTNGSGAVVKNDLEIRGSSTTYAKSGIQKNVWYQVTLNFDFVAKTCTTVVKEAGAEWWSPYAVTGGNNGNSNWVGLFADGNPDVAFYVDNFKTVTGWVPLGYSQVTIADGQTSATVTITPVDDATNEGDETLRFILAADNTYQVVSTEQDTLVIQDNDTGTPGTTVVTITASDASAAEQGQDTGAFTLSRNGTTGDLTVYYTIGGTTTASDYAPTLTGSAVIASGQSSVVVTVTPVDDTAIEVSESLILRISPNAGYTVGASNTATVTLANNDVALPVVTITANDAAAAEQGPDGGQFTVTRNGTSGDLKVYFTVGGTATAADYQQSGLTVTTDVVQDTVGVLTIPNGQSSATITLTPVNDSTIEAKESVQLVVNPNAQYTVGQSSNSVVTITDNDLPTVSVSATTPNANEQGSTTGVFTFTRNSTVGDLPVKFSVGGSASNLDYKQTLTGIYGQSFDVLESGLPINGQDNWSSSAGDVIQSAVAVSGNALKVTSADGAYRGGVFEASATAPQQRMTFDLRFGDVIGDFAGTPNLDLQEGVTLRGPNSNNTFHLIYKAYTDSSGNVLKNDLEIRGSDFMYTKSGVEKDVWYTVTADFDWTTRTCNLEVKRDGVAWWNPTSVTAYNDGNANAVTFNCDDTPATTMYVDNLLVSAIPARDSVVIIPDGQTSANVSVTAVDDGLVEGSETVQLAITSDAAYTTGAPSSATVNIVDKDSPAFPGDFNFDGLRNAQDIDMLFAAIRSGTNPAAYDLTGGGLVNSADIDQLILTLLGTRYGDFNLDHKVNLDDASLQLTNWQGSGKGWAQGDCTGDGRVNLDDASLLLTNWGWVAPAPAAPATAPASAFVANELMADQSSAPVAEDAVDAQPATPDNDSAAAAVVVATASLAGGSDPRVATASPAGSDPRVATATPALKITRTPGTNALNLTGGKLSKRITHLAKLGAITVKSLPDHDRLTVGAGVKAVTLSGGAGNGTLKGGYANDDLFGQASTDRPYSGSRGDYLYGDSGDDELLASKATHNWLTGAAGTNRPHWYSRKDHRKDRTESLL